MLDLRIEKILEARKIHVQLQRTPQALARFLLIARAHQQVQRFGMIREQVRRDVRADIAGGPGQENGHSDWVSGRRCRRRARRACGTGFAMARERHAAARARIPADDLR